MGSDPCALADRWTLDPTLAGMLVRLQERVREEFRRAGSPYPFPDIYVISGFRTPAHNADVGGVPNSLHTRCPSMAVDIRVGSVAGLQNNEILAILGGIWRLMGGRWGGSFRDPDPPHFDLGVGVE